MGEAMALYGAAAPAGGTAGVFLGGVVTEYLSWPWVFVVYIPIGVATLLAVPALLPAVAGRRGSVDVLGGVAVTAGIALAVFAIVRAPEQGRGSAATLLELAGAVVLLALFPLVQRVIREPLMPPAVWRTPGLPSPIWRWRCWAPPGSRCGASSTSICSRSWATAPSPAERPCSR
ncbi:hypothetical protein [Microbispora amethystogenes]|uniref:Major facilitator superfamily (MFS) profile domain-containing protein n=1 Tax=Microbispora amethystogenes TaxID=1427754 RepID=A0ABQ4FER1_9ACTN|nr:hypothetical protein [Microbispora amethystogenes]GIH33298.1 hypothetical protein Mam01_34620 [Microbispora amethystogenes]